MGRKHLLGTLCVSMFIAATLVSCQAAEPDSVPVPQPDDSPLASPIETPVPTAESTPKSTPSACPEGCIVPSQDCPIKAVITGMGDRHYFTPDMERYGEVPLNITYGGRWFCTEEEAVQAGFVKAPE